MRKLALIVLVCLSASLVNTAFAQADLTTLGFNYSALIRDTIGRVQPLKSVRLRFTFLLGQNGTSVNSPWIETQTTTTDSYGFVNIVIGKGTKTGGTAATFAAVDFATTNYWILIQVYNTYSLTYDALAKEALQTVPYAKVAGSLVGGSIIPSGTIVAFGGDLNHIPAGWLWCNGQELDNTDPKYQALFNAIQYNWGTSNHTNIFRIPFTAGLFLRGIANGYGGDPDRDTRRAVNIGGNTGDNVGSYQDDGIKTHKHDFTYYDTYFSEHLSGTNTGTYWGSGDTDKDNNRLQTKEYGTTSDGSANSLITETRPRNVYVNYIIKL